MAQANNQFLNELQRSLQCQDKNLEMYGFLLPLRDTELKRERLAYTNETQTILYEQLDTLYPKNRDQHSIFDTIIDSVTNPSKDKRFFFMDGPGGTGKQRL